MTTISSWSDAREALSDISEELFAAGLIEASCDALLSAMSATIAHHRGAQWDESWLTSAMAGMPGGDA